MLYASCAAFDGQLDATFNGGTVITFINNFSTISATAIQADGKIVSAGYSGTSASAIDFTLARYNTNGLLDSTFGVNGIRTTFLGGTANQIHAIVIQPDGKIVVGGQGTVDNAFVLARYTADGTPDSTFGTAGTVVTVLSAPAGIFGIALQADGKIVVVGQPLSAPKMFIVARYYENGAIDNGLQGGSGFGINGVALIDLPGADDASSIAVQEDGKIVVGGSAGPIGMRTFAAARLDTKGALDLSFGGVGSVTTAFPADAQGANLIVQPDGKIILIGSTGQLNMQDFALVRYHSDGTLDSGFGMGGVTTTAIGNNDQIFQVVLQPDGKLVVAGFSDVNGIDNFALARYNTNGVLDVTFNPSGTMPGVVVTPFNGGLASEAFQVALQQDGSIVASGAIFNVPSSNFGFGLARYLNNNPLVATQITAPINNILFSNDTFTISGIAQNPSNIGIFADGILIGRAVTSGTTNSWSAQTTVPLANGSHVITAVAEYKNGNVNLLSTNSVTINIDSCRSSLSSAIASKYCSGTVV